MKKFLKGVVFGIFLSGSAFLLISFIIKKRTAPTIINAAPILSANKTLKKSFFHTSNYHNKEVNALLKNRNKTIVEKRIDLYRKMDPKEIVREITKLTQDGDNISYTPGQYSENFLHAFSFYYIIYKITDKTPVEAINIKLDDTITIQWGGDSYSSIFGLPSIWEQAIMGGSEDQNSNVYTN